VHELRFGLLLLGMTLSTGVAASALSSGVAVALVVAAATATIGTAIVAVTGLVRARGRIGPIGLQVALGAGGATLVGTAGIGLVTVLGGDASGDRVALASVGLCVALLVPWTAYVIGMAVGADVDRISSGLMAVGEGDRDVRLDTNGGDQVSRLAEAGNQMIDQLTLRAAERDEAQRTRQDLLRAMVDQLRERAAERDAAEEQRKELFVGVSHDLRTPLTSLQLLVSAIRDDMASLASRQERADYADQMLAQIASLTQLTEQVFEFSRLEAGDLGGSRVRMSIEEVIRETVVQTRPSAAARDVELELDVSEGLPAVEVAPDRIARVLHNLMQNALAHTPPGGTVRIAARTAQAGVEAEVSDTGSGIAPSERERIFEPFFRGGASAARTTVGTGLGLAISRAIVEAHGGRIWVAGAEHGTTIRFGLPFAGEASADA